MHRTNQQNHVNNLFDDGSSSVDGDGTKLSADEFNSYQEESSNLIEHSGLVLNNPGSDTYLQLIQANKVAQYEGYGGLATEMRQLVMTLASSTTDYNDVQFVDDTVGTPLIISPVGILGFSFEYFISRSGSHATFGKFFAFRRSSFWESFFEGTSTSDVTVHSIAISNSGNISFDFIKGSGGGFFIIKKYTPWYDTRAGII